MRNGIHNREDEGRNEPQMRQEGETGWQAWMGHRMKRGALLYWSVLLMAAAGFIHLMGALLQPAQSGVLATFLFYCAVVQIGLALVVALFPARRFLLAAALVEAGAALLWLIAHTSGLPDGSMLWQPETLGTPDLYLPFMEGISAFFLLCLFSRTWTLTSRAGRIVLAWLPALLILGLLAWGATRLPLTEVVLATFILDAGLPTSLQYLFLPAVGLLALLLILRVILPRLRARTPGAVRATMALLPALLIINILAWSGGIIAADTAWFPVPPTSVKAAAGQTTTLEYCRAGETPLAMDLSEPAAQAVRPAPVVFYIHGGEALQGSRTLIDGTEDGVYFTRLREMLVGHGFVVGSIDYGLSPLFRVPDGIKAAKCAVRFLRAHAGELGIDPQRIGVYGPSQGGYISAVLGTMGPETGFDVGQYLNQSSRVQAVVDMWGPTDLSNFSGSPSWVSNLKQGIGGGKGSVAGLRAQSPLYHVAHNDPPFLIIHGSDDWFIAPHHSQDLAKHLTAAGVPNQLVIIQNDAHGLVAPVAGKVEQPSPDELIQMISNFFVRTLGAVTR